MTDYESALRIAFLHVVPDAQITSCFFHFKQAVKKNARKHGTLMKFIKSNSEARALYYKLMSLPLLPAQHIEESFNKLKEFCAELQVRESQDAIFDRFLQYYYNQWIRGTRVSAI